MLYNKEYINKRQIIMLTEQELSYQIVTGNQNVILDEEATSVDIPIIEMRTMMIHNALIHRIDKGSLPIEEVDWSSFMDSIFENNHGIDFINRVSNEQLRTKILNYWIDNYDMIVGNEWRKALWTSEWRELCSK